MEDTGSLPLKSDLRRILDLLTLAGRLKTELRHSWLPGGRQESVAEHTWRVALMVLLMAPHLSRPVDLEKCLKMAIIHDLAEAETGDIPVFTMTGPEARARKMQVEQDVMARIRDRLGPPIGPELYGSWEEYEENACFEAQFVRALDKVEVQLQHNEAGLSTWQPFEKLMVFQSQWMERFCTVDPALRALAALVREQAVGLMAAAGDDVAALEEKAQAPLSVT